MPYPAWGPFQTQGKWELSSAGVPLGSFLLAGKVRAFLHSLPPPLTAVLASLLHPSSAGRGSSACTCEWSNVTAFPSVLPARTHLPQTWYISTGGPHSLATSTHSQLLFHVSLRITNPDLQPVSVLHSACRVTVPQPPKGGPDYDPCKLPGPVATWC